jgi:hypothetical protein
MIEFALATPPAKTARAELKRILRIVVMCFPLFYPAGSVFAASCLRMDLHTDTTNTNWGGQAFFGRSEEGDVLFSTGTSSFHKGLIKKRFKH